MCTELFKRIFVRDISLQANLYSLKEDSLCLVQISFVLSFKKVIFLQSFKKGPYYLVLKNELLYGTFQKKNLLSCKNWIQKKIFCFSLYWALLGNFFLNVFELCFFFFRQRIFICSSWKDLCTWVFKRGSIVVNYWKEESLHLTYLFKRRSFGSCSSKRN